MGLSSVPRSGKTSAARPSAASPRFAVFAAMLAQIVAGVSSPGEPPVGFLASVVRSLEHALRQSCRHAKTTRLQGVKSGHSLSATEPLLHIDAIRRLGWCER